MTMPIKDLTGRRFTKLVVLRLHPERTTDGRTKWVCRCDCSDSKAEKIVIVIGKKLLSGKTKSCGCRISDINKNRLTTHGMSGTKVYFQWAAMLDRCRNKNNPHYHNYGGRGISVCDRWLDFDNFYKDMGDPPSGYTLERRENDRGYSPDNCSWESRKKQANNRRTNRLLTFNEETHSLAEWSRKVGKRSGTVLGRLTKGWSVEDALTTPLLRSPTRS